MGGREYPVELVLEFTLILVQEDQKKWELYTFFRKFDLIYTFLSCNMQKMA